MPGDPTTALPGIPLNASQDLAAQWLTATVVAWCAFAPAFAFLAQALGWPPATERRVLWTARIATLIGVTMFAPAPAATAVKATAEGLAVTAFWFVAGAVISQKQPQLRLISLVAVTACLTWAVGIETLGIYDGALLAALFFAGSRVRGPLMPTLRAIGYVVFFSALLLEAAVRLAAPTPQRLPHPIEATLLQSPPDDPRCAALFPGSGVRYARVFELRSDGPPRAKTVLHVGDSMTEGLGAGGVVNAFPAVLSRRQTDVAHINGAFGATGTDFHSILIDDWTERLRVAGKPVDLVVLHYFGNDDADLGYKYSCCANETLMQWQADEPKRRCTEPRRQSGMSALLAHSPAPYPLRVTGWISMASTQLTLQLWGLNVEPIDHVVAGRRVVTLVAAISKRLAARGIDFIIVDIGSVPEHPGRLADQKDIAPIASYADRAGIEWHSADRALRAHYDTDARRLLVAADGTHYGKRGHEVLADWLGPIIKHRLDARP